MKAVVLGGSGFIGQQLLKDFQTHGWQAISISRHGKPKQLQSSWADQVVWIQSDILKDNQWQAALKDADWVIDAIGILFEKPKQSITYLNAIVLPLQTISDFLIQQQQPVRLLFISANRAPWPLKKYMQAKLTAEKILQQPDRAKLHSVIIYPGLVVDAAKPATLIVEWGSRVLYHLPFFKKWIRAYMPVRRTLLSQEIIAVMQDQSSIYTKRR